MAFVEQADNFVPSYSPGSISMVLQVELSPSLNSCFASQLAAIVSFLVNIK
jgi:hypothetical protein